MNPPRLWAVTTTQRLSNMATIAQSRYSFDASRHVHTLNGVPLYGTTTVLDVLGKNLTYWASGQACAEFGWINQRPSGKPKPPMEEVLAAAQKGHDLIKGMTIEQYVKHLDKAYRAHNTHKEKAADDGVDLHFGLELYIKSKMTDGKIHLTTAQLEKMMPFIDWAEKNVKRWLFSEIHCYSERLWCGGIVDNCYIDLQDRIILGDFKSAKDIYFSNVCQLGGYDIQLMENGGFTATGERILTLPEPIQGHAVFYFGGGFKEPAISYQVDRNKRAFESALSLYRDRQSFETEFNKESWK